MRVSCLQENLSKGLGVVGRAVASKTTLPMISNVLLSIEQSRLKLAATNLEIAITCWIGAKVEEEGAIAIPARLLSEFINSLPNERIDMSLLPRQRILSLRCARFEARINGMDAEDFPPIPLLDEASTISLDPAELHSAITQVVFAAATDDTRPVLTGIHFRLEGNQVTLAAADGFRLAIRKLPLVTPVAEKMELIIPARSLAELNRLLGDETEPVQLAISAAKNQVLFRLKNVVMVSQLIQGTFPNYNQLIPQSYQSRAVVTVADFQRAARTASIFAKDGSGIIRLQITPGAELSPGRMAISARAEEYGDNMGEIDATVDGEGAKIAFNSIYLMNVLGVIDEEEVALETTSPSSPGVLRPVGSENYLHVVMPMFVQW